MADASRKDDVAPKLSPKPSAELASDPEEDDLSDLDGKSHAQFPHVRSF
jgi:hypothetical protein